MTKTKSEVKNYKDLEKFCLGQGSKLFGVADIVDIKSEFDLSDEVKQNVKYAVSLGITLSSFVLSEIKQQPTKLYFHHYRTANMFLDQLSFAVANWIETQGFLALAVPASQITDWEKQSAHLSHRKIATLAGTGWMGRNNLLVTKKFGSRVRLATVLTDMPLEVDKPLKEGCGECFACVAVCPAKAIKNDIKDFQYLACREKLKDFQKQNIVGQFICGVCVKACKGRE